MKLFVSSALMLLAAASPFDSCGSSWHSKIEQDETKQANTPKLCTTDPPNGCGVLCPTPDVAARLPPVPPGGVWQTDFCSEVSAGALTRLFITDAQTILECDTESVGDSYVVFPTFFSITPNVVEMGDGCIPPPPPPPILEMKDIVGGEGGDQ